MVGKSAEAKVFIEGLISPGAPSPVDRGPNATTTAMLLSLGKRRKGQGSSTSVCQGILVVHRDGTPVLCSEELSGRPCAAAHAYEWHTAIHSCALTFVHGCPTCPAMRVTLPVTKVA